MTVAVGYRKVANEDRIEKEPDRRVQQAIELVCARSRNDHGIAVYREGERAERGELNLLEAAEGQSTTPGLPFSVNLDDVYNSARMLGLSVPQSLLATAGEVIE